MAQLVMDAGANFVLAPDFNPQVVSMVHEKQKLMIPAVATPSEILQACRMGVDLRKLFPANGLGVNYLKELQGPLNNLSITPVGGVTLNNVADFAQAGAFAVGVGSELINKTLVVEQEWQQLTELAQTLLPVSAKIKSQTTFLILFDSLSRSDKGDLPQYQRGLPLSALLFFLTAMVILHNPAQANAWGWMAWKKSIARWPERWICWNWWQERRNAGTRDELTITEISTQLGIPKSTTFDIIYTLVYKGYLEIANPRVKSFRLGLKLFQTGAVYLDQTPFREAARSVLEEPAAAAQETSFLAMENDGML